MAYIFCIFAAGALATRGGKKAELSLGEAFDLVAYPIKAWEIQRCLVATLTDQLDKSSDNLDNDEHKESTLVVSVLSGTHTPVLGVRSARCIVCWQGPSPGQSVCNSQSTVCILCTLTNPGWSAPGAPCLYLAVVLLPLATQSCIFHNAFFNSWSYLFCAACGVIAAKFSEGCTLGLCLHWAPSLKLRHPA